jgi:hypothetical protein
MQVEDKFKHEYRPNNLKTIVSQLYIACRLHETHAHYTISKITGRRPCVGVSPTNPFALWLQKEPVFGEIQKSLFEHFCLPAACGNFREATLSTSITPTGCATRYKQVNCVVQSAFRSHLSHSAWLLATGWKYHILTENTTVRKMV